jgi:predicted nucleic acid-binding Zn ribbon protein
VPRRTDDDEEWEDDWASDDEEPTIPCPYCGREILEDLVRCPHCENYLSREDAPPQRKSWLMIFGVALCLLIVGFWIFAG